MLDQITQQKQQPTLLPMSEKERAVCAIRAIRQDWENLVSGQSLIDTQGSVGLLLADLVCHLGLNRTEQVTALGESLFVELEQLEVL